MKIAVLNPYSGSVAEVESYQWFYLAAESMGHEAILCHDEREIQECNPDFVFNLSFQNPKLTCFPTYGLLNLPTSILKSAPRFIRNCLTYDAVFVLAPDVATWYSDFCAGIRKSANIFPLAVTPHAVPMEGKIDFSTASIAYTGTNWDGPRLKDVFEILCATGDVSFYGPPEKWSHVSKQSVKGLVPFDGVSLLKMYRKHGIGLALTHPQFVTEQIPHNRIFEVAASGALAISSDYPMVRDWFGDSFLYVDQTRDAVQVAEDVLAHLRWARCNPEIAAGKALVAHRIFREKFAMDKLLAGALEFHRDVLAKKRYVPTGAERQGSEIINIIFPVGKAGCETIRRALDSLALQTCSGITALLVIDNRPEGFDALVQSYKRKLDIRVIECPGCNRSQALWLGLRKVEAKYFAIMYSCDEYYPNHFALLLDRIYYFKRVKAANIKVVYSGSVRESSNKELYEGSKWRDSSAFAGPHYRCIQNYGKIGLETFKQLVAGESSTPRTWLADVDLLDDEVLRGPDLDSGEDLFLLLYLLEKERFEFNYEVTACVHWDECGRSNMDERLKPNQWEKVARQMWGRQFVGSPELEALFDSKAGLFQRAWAGISTWDTKAESPRRPSLAKRLVGIWGAVWHGLPPDFDPAEYLRRNPDVAKANVDPVQHFRQFGYREGRRWK